MVAVLNWFLHHWFFIFFLAWLGFFDGVRDFAVGVVEALAGIGGRRHKRAMALEEARLKAARAEGAAALARLSGQALPKPGECVHRRVTPVVADEEVVAWLCKNCDTSLPATWAVRQEDL